MKMHSVGNVSFQSNRLTAVKPFKEGMMHKQLGQVPAGLIVLMFHNTRSPDTVD